LAGCFRSTCNPERPSGDSSGGTKAALNFSWGLVRLMQLLMLVPHFKTPRVRHAGLAAEAAAVRRPKHPIDYTRGRPLGI
jgi:hypothetical protein